MIVSLLHPGDGKQLVVGPVLDEKSSPPQSGEVRPVQK